MWQNQTRYDSFNFVIANRCHKNIHITNDFVIDTNWFPFKLNTNLMLVDVMEKCEKTGYQDIVRFFMECFYFSVRNSLFSFYASFGKVINIISKSLRISQSHNNIRPSFEQRWMSMENQKKIPYNKRQTHSKQKNI